MLTEKLKIKIRSTIKNLQKYADRIWYTPLIGILAALDNIIIIIPTDGILISSSILIPKRWILFAISIALGSTLGALFLAWLVEYQGLPWILNFYPGLSESKTWKISMDLFEKYGLILVFIVAVTPLMQQPAVILASLAKTPLIELTAIIFLGRLIKYLIMAYIGSHTPKLLSKLFGLKEELEEVGVVIKSER